MRKRTTALFAVAALSLAACGVDDTGGGSEPGGPDGVLLQTSSEGGFAPVERSLGSGPTHTLLADGRLIYEGPVIEIYPQPLLPNYQVGTVSDAQMDEIMRLVEEIGLPDFTDERDDENGQNVADATTEVITYWDDNGTHTYSVYALGIDPSPANDSTAAFLELFNYMFDVEAEIKSDSYAGETVQLIAGPGFSDPEFPDTREWPLDEGTDGWTVLPNEWRCTTTDDVEVLDSFEDATWNTLWTNPDDPDADPVKLIVRPLLPGEEPCFGN